MTRKDVGYLCGLLALLAASAAVVNPLFEHPVYDDWAYAKNVLRFLEEGRLYFVWTQTAFLFQFIVGVVFSKVLGFSFATLHLSTLAFSAVGLVALYALLRQMDQGETESFLLTAAMFCTVFYFHLTFSFMTDVPSVATALAAIAVEYRAQRSRSTRWYLASALAFTAAVLTRDLIGVAVIGLLIQAGWRRQLHGARLFLLVPLLVWGAYLGFGSRLITMPWRQMKVGPPRAASGTAWLPTLLLGYVVCAQLAFQFSPVLLSLLPQALRRRHGFRRSGLFIGAAIALPAVLACLQYHHPTEPDDRLMPYRQGFISIYGVQKKGRLPGQSEAIMGTPLRVGMTAAAVVGCSVLIISSALVARDAVRRLASSRRARRSLALVAVACGVAGFLPRLLKVRWVVAAVPTLSWLRRTMRTQTAWALRWAEGLVFLGVVSCAVLLVAIHVRAGKINKSHPYAPLPESPAWPVLLYALGSVIFYLVSGKFFLRYAMVLIPGLYVVLRYGLGRLKPVRAVLVPLIIVSLAAGTVWTKDLINLNQARWKAGRWLLERNVPPDWIEGGVEFNGWHLPYGAAPKSSLHQPSRYMSHVSIIPRFLLTLDTFAPLSRRRRRYDGRSYRRLALFPYQSLLERRTRNVMVWADTAVAFSPPPGQ